MTDRTESRSWQEQHQCAAVADELAALKADNERLRKEVEMWRPLTNEESERLIIHTTNAKRLREQIATLRAALLPFAVAGRSCRLVDDSEFFLDDLVVSLPVPVSAWRKAVELTGGQP